ITAATPGSTTAVAKTVGSEQFGMCVDVTGTTNLSAQAPYNDTVANCHGIVDGAYVGSSVFGFDDTNGTNGTNGANGSFLLGSTAANPVTGSGSLVFFGNVAPTTEYGTYQSNLQLVATSTY
ncbi:MAG TPA: hypothetical protein VFN56_02345, partial [Candidatus Saccharimonadales bacterium]|nr:hypothetical protein [Candidatus Saccharimonadales bacterium]